ncbi:MULTISPECIES: SDR family NAD(P)-dependent oxidoreductase [Rhodomicrobium]|uniref:SDR family NAD(P)-dependent oxidoreductase n=1 Tax=Rhodomicrobium TaxID=1068 RepID=UPI000B4BECB5|nr:MULTISPECIES: SDR family NAD(P)-dependent oxidoreductase [Rhodomicrobium]
MSFATPSFALDGKTALVIGGSSGIGREIALGFQGAGAKVLIAARGQERLDRVSAELGAEAGARIAYAADLRDVGALATLCEIVRAEHGALHILVNCQGVTEIKPAIDLTEAEYDAILDTNLKSVFFACTLFGRGMIERGEGAIINISSLAAHTGWANAAAYCASKWGVAGITQSLAAEWGESGVRVNAIAPGFFMTDLNRAKMPEARKAEARRRSAMKRMGELPELVGAAIFLASDAARFVTGSSLRVDGGYLSSGI